MWQIEDTGFSVIGFTYKLNWFYTAVHKFIHPTLHLFVPGLDCEKTIISPDNC